jgi:hypothetical protein
MTSSGLWTPPTQPRAKSLPLPRKCSKAMRAGRRSIIFLGWLIDTVRGTIELPPHRLERVQEWFDLFRGQRGVAKKQWHQLLGELRSMTLAIPGGTGMFSHLQEALRLHDKSRVKLTQAVHDQLADFEFFTRSLSERPTRIAETWNSPASSATKMFSLDSLTAVSALLLLSATTRPLSPGSKRGPSPTTAPLPTSYASLRSISATTVT